MSSKDSSGVSQSGSDLPQEGDHQHATEIIQDPTRAEQTLEDGRILAFSAVQASPRAARAALEDPYVYTLTNPDTRWSVAHEAVKQDLGAARKALADPAIHRQANQNGYTVLHMAVKCWEEVAREALKDPRLYRLAESNGQTVAHCAVDAHPRLATLCLEDSAIYRLQAEFGDTVAHWAAEQTAEAGLKALRDPEIYRMTGRKGRRVAGRCCAHKGPARKVLSDPNLRSLDADGPGQSVVEWALSHYPAAVEALLELPALWSEVLSDQETFLGFALRHHQKLGERVLERPGVAATPADPTESIGHRAVDWSASAVLKLCSDPELAAITPPTGGRSVGQKALRTVQHRQLIEDRLQKLGRQSRLEGEVLENLWKVYLEHSPRWANRFRASLKAGFPELFERLSLLSLSTDDPEIRKEALRDLGRSPTRS